jgi:hypothetical protein
MKFVVMEKQYLTVVFEYEEGAKYPSELTSAFANNDGKFKDVNITAMSREDEITRIEKLESLAEAE